MSFGHANLRRACRANAVPLARNDEIVI